VTKDLEKSYLEGKPAQSEIITITPHDPTTRFNPDGSSSSTAGEDVNKIGGSSTPASFAKVDEELDDGTDEKYLNPVSNATLARMEEEGATDNDFNEVDDVEDEDEKEDTKDDPDESVIN
jgi:hypothetical protein